MIVIGMSIPVAPPSARKRLTTAESAEAPRAWARRAAPYNPSPRTMTMSRKRIRTRPAASAERNRAKKITTPTFIANQEELWASHRAGSAAQDSHGRAYGLETTNSAAAHWETGTTGDAS